jgi:hypothetical protein
MGRADGGANAGNNSFVRARISAEVKEIVRDNTVHDTLVYLFSMVAQCSTAYSNTPKLRMVSAGQLLESDNISFSTLSIDINESTAPYLTRGDTFFVEGSTSNDGTFTVKDDSYFGDIIYTNETPTTEAVGADVQLGLVYVDGSCCDATHGHPLASSVSSGFMSSAAADALNNIGKTYRLNHSASPSTIGTSWATIIMADDAVGNDTSGVMSYQATGKILGNINGNYFASAMLTVQASSAPTSDVTLEARITTYFGSVHFGIVKFIYPSGSTQPLSIIIPPSRYTSTYSPNAFTLRVRRLNDTSGTIVSVVNDESSNLDSSWIMLEKGR